MALVPVQHVLYLAAFLFCVGLIVVLTKRNAVMALLGLELMLNAANINLISFNQLYPEAIHGQLFVLFVIVVAVCEAAVGLAIVLRVYRFYQTSVPDELRDLKEH